jgi:hypothetical protein
MKRPAVCQGFEYKAYLAGPGMVGHVCNPSTQEAGAGGFKVSLGYIPYLKTKTKPKNLTEGMAGVV